VVESSVDTIQLGNQGHPLGSSSTSPPPPSFNMPPTEHAQTLHRNLAAELIQAGSGKSPLLPSRIRSLQELSTAVYMNNPLLTRKNNLNSSLQDGRTNASSPPAQGALISQARQDEHRAAIAAREDQLQRFGEACEATVVVARETEALALAETTEEWRVRENVESEMRAYRHRLAERKAERLRLKEASSVPELSAPAEAISEALVPVLDMLCCINHLNEIRREAGDFSLKDFSDYWAPDNQKTTPNKPNTFVPNRVVQGNNPLWAPFYDREHSRQSADGSLQVDPNHPPFFRVSQELLGRMLHTFKIQEAIRGQRREKEDRQGPQ
jgi:hypothetical protein